MFVRSPRIGRRPRRRSPPTLIGAAPALALVTRWRTELAVLRRRARNSDAVATLSDCVTELEETIAASGQVAIQLTLAEAHALSRIPVATLRWACRRRTEALGARKVAGAWYLDRSKFEVYLVSLASKAGVGEGSQ